MRRNIVHPGAGELHYEIRAIVEFANRLQGVGMDIIWENIGDPVAKGEHVPNWLKQLVSEAAREDASYAYSPTNGLQGTREYLARKRSVETGRDLAPEDIVFFNGLGDAISKVYTWLNPKSRVLGPCPAYPTHSSVEAAHGRDLPLTYELNPDDSWLPDMTDVRNKIMYNPSIAGLLIINPDNPTGMVYPVHILQEFVSLAQEFNLFLIADEIYANLVYPDVEFVSIASICETVPTIIMRGLSKELPWPGARCGWIEVYNKYQDMQFADYIKSIVESKMQEVCATTLPQFILPLAMEHPEYQNSISARVSKYQRRSNQLKSALSGIDGVTFVEPKGAFYATIVISPGIANRNIEIPNQKAQALLEEYVLAEDDMAADKLFCMRVLASTGLCLVPLTGFSSPRLGFRMTLLEEDDTKFTNICNTLISVLS
ncbi:pyridoxal phosphate-dependent aminotransferase [Candidatus Saccharibacteria bacterium]|nr:pyridoxal phosphate-dependent aminotransferase [Candidatus Saccharibacteria bacterium]